MNVTLISDGVPNISSEQANNDPWIFIEEFKRRKFKVDYICLINKDINTSNIKNDKLLKFFKSKFKNLDSIKVINLESKGYLVKIKYFFMRLFTKNPNYFYGSKIFNYKVINHIEKK
tara:strand:+ start:116 stop:466 length:351 start_codon:yes stop_codon:yes gene_type:complete